jgi:hypothetical protein
MKSFVLALLLTLAQPVTAQTWLHVYGRSWHDSPGYREINTGIGIERQFTNDWTWAIGTYRNSIYRQSVVGMAKYQWYQQGDFSVNIQMGGVTGYRRYPVVPMVLPEACWTWICGMAVPRVSNETRSAVAVYLRIPL